MPKNYIIHSGIKGQKWGIRRFQNNDGTYTEEGKARRRKEYSDDYKRYVELSKRDPRTLSNKELSEYNNRANLEVNYRRLAQEQSTIKKGMAAAGLVTAAIGATIGLSTALGNASTKIVKPAIAVGKAVIEKMILDRYL